MCFDDAAGRRISLGFDTQGDAPSSVRPYDAAGRRISLEFGCVDSVEADFVLSNGRDARCPSPSRGREDGERVAVGNLHDPPDNLCALRGHSARDCEHEHESGDGAGRHCRGSG